MITSDASRESLWNVLEAAGDFHLAQLFSYCAALELSFHYGIVEGLLSPSSDTKEAEWSKANEHYAAAAYATHRITKKHKELFIAYSTILLAVWIGFMRGILISRHVRSGETASEAARGPLKGQPGSPGACGSRSPQARIQGNKSESEREEEAMIEVKMILDRVTKGAVRYMEPGHTAAHKVGGLYLRKDALPQPWPGAITVVVTPEPAAKE